MNEWTPLSKHLVTVRRKNFFLTGKTLRRNQAQGGAAIFRSRFGVMGSRQYKRHSISFAKVKAFRACLILCHLHKRVPSDYALVTGAYGIRYPGSLIQLATEEGVLSAGCLISDLAQCTAEKSNCNSGIVPLVTSSFSDVPSGHRAVSESSHYGIKLVQLGQCRGRVISKGSLDQHSLAIPHSNVQMLGGTVFTLVAHAEKCKGRWSSSGFNTI